MKIISPAILTLFLILLTACASIGQPNSSRLKTSSNEATVPSIQFEKYTLDNGLDVVLHVDRSDPIVAINIAAHVGSGREVSDRTGFAHLFEHLLFLDSENLGYGGLDEMNTRIGGEGTNGFTTTDMTQYFQAVPADALEKVIWAEADKLGFFINTVTQPVIDNEKQVVKNEKRQRVDNQPYGHTQYVLGKALYPQDHPYNWQIIGSLADLDAATLEDVKEFYRRWYVPNNVTLTLTGDFEVTEAKRLINQYFGEIPKGPKITPQAVRASDLQETISLFHEDTFATVPQLTMAWPAVDQFHPDSYALEILAEYLSVGKRAPLNEVLIDEQKLTSDIASYFYGKEAAGEFYITVNANAGEDLDALVPAIQEAMQRFEQRGVSGDDLDRIKAGLEVTFYRQIQSVLGKAIQLGQYNTLARDPDRINTDIQRIRAVTPQDITRVYQSYIKGRPYVATSFVPAGQSMLAVAGSSKARVVEEKIVQDAEAEVEFDPAQRDFTRTPSSFDRTVEPPFGKPYQLPQPIVWNRTLANGMEVYGIKNRETPLVYFSLRIDAGRDRGDAAKPAIPSLTADLLNKGTANKTTAELEDAIKSLGSQISISAQNFGVEVSGHTLARNFEQTIALAEEMLLRPRWDNEEFALLKLKQINQLDLDASNPNTLAVRESAKLAYPDDHIFSHQDYGTKAKLESVTIDDLKSFYKANYAAASAQLRVVGSVNAEQVEGAFRNLAREWRTPENPAVSLPQAASVERSQLYFYDIPDAKQSVLQFSRPSLSALHPDYPLANAVNFLLGDIYTSKLNTELRVNKGYTYGIRSGFSAARDRGSFIIRSSVRSNVTKESIELIKSIVQRYGPDFSQADLEILKTALLRGQALQNETLSAKLGMLDAISRYAYPHDYQAQHAELIERMDLTNFKRITATYLRPDAMNYLVVGDAQTQLDRLAELGLGKPILLGPLTQTD